ncbi:MAG: hypothetical protein ABJM06_14175 [Gilvibacter sp.]
MRGVYTLLFFAFSMFNCWAQTQNEIQITDVFGKTYTAVYQVTIDSQIFSEREKNIYSTKDKSAKVAFGYSKVAYSAYPQKLDYDHTLNPVLEQKEIMLDGVPFFYEKLEQYRATDTIIMVSYKKKYDPISTIVIEGVFPKGEDQKYKPLIEQVAKSVQLIKQ